jgi:hypothetical protein
MGEKINMNPTPAQGILGKVVNLNLLSLRS